VDVRGTGTVQAGAGAGRAGRRKARTRAALLEAGRRLLAQRGPADTTIAEITAQANLGFGTFYLYFQSKEELLATVVSEGMAELLQELDRATAGLDDLGERQRAAVRAYLHFAHDNGDLFQIVLRAAPSWADLAQRHQQPFLERIEASLREGIAAGEVRAGSVELRANMILACVRWMGLWWVDHDGPTPDQVADELIGFIETGIRQPESPPAT
jgi:AcrR family transcriptional regulator